MIQCSPKYTKSLTWIVFREVIIQHPFPLCQSLFKITAECKFSKLQQGINCFSFSQSLRKNNSRNKKPGPDFYFKPRFFLNFLLVDFTLKSCGEAQNASCLFACHLGISIDIRRLLNNIVRLVEFRRNS